MYHILTFFSHQNSYLKPHLFAVWNQYKAELLKELNKEKRPFVLGGDSRADSSSHSAKMLGIHRNGTEEGSSTVVSG